MGEEEIKGLSADSLLQKYLELRGLGSPLELSDEEVFRLSPEMNGMKGFLAQRVVDKVVLYHTETEDALACVNWIIMWLRDKFRVRVEPRPIPIKDVRDAEHLALGLRRFIADLHSVLTRSDVKRAAERGEAFLNVTGGLKSITQIALVFSYLHGIPPYYIFERTDRAFVVPCVPITYQIKQGYKEALEKFRKKTPLTMEELAVTKAMAEELLRRGLIEQTDEKKYRLTEMGKVIFNVFEKK